MSGTMTARASGFAVASRARGRALTVATMMLALPSGGCLDAADGRARLDLLVGQAEGSPGTVVVADGLATVRTLAAGEIALWAQSPVLSFRLSPRAGDDAPLSVTVENALPDAQLTASADDGRAVTVAVADSALPTVRRWTVTRPSDTPLSFTVGPPDAQASAPFRFAVFGDVQDAIDRVGDVYARMNLDPALRFVLIAGDLTEQGGADELERFRHELQSGLRIPCYATLGNHELGATEGLFQQRYGRGSYHFVYQGVHFTMLDSASAMIAPLTAEWLDGWLAAGADAVHVVAMHVPPLDPTGIRNGAFASRGEAAALVGRLAAANVDATFYGHVHTFRAFSHAGIPAYITGGGGAIPERFDGIGRHYLAVDVNPSSALLEPALVRVYPED